MWFSFSAPGVSRGTRKRAEPLPRTRSAFSGGPPRREPVRRMAGEPKPAGRHSPKQKLAVPPGAARRGFPPSSEAVPGRREGQKGSEPNCRNRSILHTRKRRCDHTAKARSRKHLAVRTHSCGYSDGRPGPPLRRTTTTVSAARQDVQRLRKYYRLMLVSREE